ncbi:MAG: SPFH domain-containing protein [Planctomycetota bacterium]|nr:SPFH domain-containing protein [Planctomycetota bacterium]
MAKDSNDHDSRHRRPVEAAGVQVDPAGESLADALRVSFRLLTVIMIGVSIAFLATGIRFIEPQEVGVKKLFGRVTSVAEEGLAYTWPFPIGEIDIVSTKEQSLVVDDFWMHETAADKTKDLLSRRVSGEGLRPIWDGALLTGDRGLLHVRLTCTYMVHNAVDFRRHVGSKYVTQAPVTQSDVTVDPKIEVIRSAVCKAAIRAAATRTVDGLQRTERDAFAADVLRLAQDELDGIGSGLRINKVLLTSTTWPLRALPAYSQAQTAVSKAEKLKYAAMSEAEKTLNDAAGPNYRKLVGDPSRFSRSERYDAAEPYDLIGQYEKARASADTAEADDLLKQIDRILLSSTTGGEASQVLAEAKSYQTEVRERVKSRADRFNELLPEYRKNKQFMLHRLWAVAREEILSAAQVEKIYFPPGKGKTVYRIKRPQAIADEILRQRLKVEKQKETEDKSR